MKSQQPQVRQHPVCFSLPIPIPHVTSFSSNLLSSTSRKAYVKCSISKSQIRSVQPLPSPTQRYYDFSNHQVEAIRVTHCQLLSEHMAEYVYQTVQSKKKSLSEMARLLSTFETTRLRNGDTSWITVTDNESTQIVDKEFLHILLNARPQTLSISKLSYGWEVFVVEDVKHAVVPSSRGQIRRKGYPITPNMRRTASKKPNIDPMSYHVQTFGCQMNMSDSERISAELDRIGYHSTDDAKRSSLYILNTCALREHAEDKVYSYLGEHAQRKWDAPNEVTLVVAGCVAQQEGEKLLTRVPELDIIMGPQYANRIGDVVQDFERNLTQIVAVDPIHIQEDISKPKRTSKLTAWVNIIYGCLERCTYCVVPNTRGLEQSRSMEQIKKEVSSLAAEGYKEVVLLGQNVDAYGRDLSPRRTLSDLLRFIHDVDGIERIRFTTGHPRYISENLIETVASLSKVMEHFHIPPQSGDNGVLKEMRRGYTSERYIKIVERIRSRMPDASICADMIVGFPGETDEAFENTVCMTDEVVFDSNMVRAYSARPNTPAGERDDQISEEVKAERLGIMNRKMREQALQRSKRYLNRKVEVLVEGPNPKKETEMSGRERTNRMVFFEGDQKLVGKLVEVEIYEAFAFSLKGKLVGVVVGD